MEGYSVSINGNLLSVSLLGAEEVFEKELPKDVVSEGTIQDLEKFAENLGDLILENFGAEQKKLPLHFLIPPSEVFLSFLTGSKKEKDFSEESLLTDATKRLAGVAMTLDDVYLSYQKIAPFVHQLVAIKKDALEKYLKVGELMGLEVKSLVPWALLLPRFLPDPVEPKIFVLKINDEKILVLAELGGIYHVGRFNEKKAAELKKLVRDLSVYERNEPITNIYFFGVESFDLGDEYKITKLGIKTLHDLYPPEMSANVINTQINLLTLLPVEEQKKSMVPAYAGVAIAAILLLLGFAYTKGYFGRQGPPADSSDAVVESSPSVVSESTESVPDGQQPGQEQVELNKAYLKLRIENGTNTGGLAGRTRDFLSPFGYEIISVGDAEESDREVTLVQFSSENAIYKDLLVTDLKEMFEEVEVLEDLSSDLDYDVLIIAGTNEK